MTARRSVCSRDRSAEILQSNSLQRAYCDVWLRRSEVLRLEIARSPEGATAGAGPGAVVGGVLGWLVGIGSLAIPGVGPFIAAGPIVAALAGVGVGGAVGSLAGALVGMGIPEYEAKRYEGRITKGGILLSVHCDTSEEIDRAKSVLERTGAEDIAYTMESSAKGTTRSATPGRR